MAASFMLHIFTPEKDFYLGEVQSVVITSTDGEMGVLLGHLPMVVALTAAPVHIKTAEGGQRIAALSGGFAQIKGDTMVILADTAEWPEDIELSRAIEAKKRAEERLQAQVSEIEYMRSRVSLERALVRLAVKNSKYKP